MSVVGICKFINIHKHYSFSHVYAQKLTRRKIIQIFYHAQKYKRKEVYNIMNVFMSFWHIQKSKWFRQAVMVGEMKRGHKNTEAENCQIVKSFFNIMPPARFLSFMPTNFLYFILLPLLIFGKQVKDFWTFVSVWPLPDLCVLLAVYNELVNEWRRCNNDDWEKRAF